MILSNGVLGLNEEVLFQSPLLQLDKDNEGMYSQLSVERTLQVFVLKESLLRLNSRTNR